MWWDKNMLSKVVNMFMLWLLFSSWVFSLVSATVSYDSKAIIINGRRRILLSGSIHYPRSTPQMWPDLIAKAKEGGLDVIQTYVFWNGHEPSPGNYYFEDRYDLVRFIKLVQQAGLYVHLRIGPYICAEWNFGGFPVWLKYVPGIAFRTDNEPFKAAMQKFTEKIVSMMKAEKLFETQGGPIIMSQIENEFGPVEWEIGDPGKAYTKWAAQMAVGLDTGVPWIMCKQDDAPDPVINTCNGFYCENFSPNAKYKPKMWTENWTGWYTEFGGAVPTRPAEDIAFSVARFIQNGGSFVNYYMYHGGTNFGRTASGLFIATSYDYDAPIDEYGLPREPKWGHLRDLHRAIKLSEPALVSADPTVTSLGSNQEGHVFKSKSGACAAFLANYDTKYSVKVTFGSAHYELPSWSITILPDCKTAVFNTARLGAQSSEKKMVLANTAFSWQSYNEESPSADDQDVTVHDRLWEQIYITRDATDYLCYMTDVQIDPDEGFLRSGQDPLLTIWSAGHALHVFINGQLSGTVYGGLENPKLTFSNNVKLRAGINKVTLLSVAVGLSNVGTHFETWNVGVLGPVTLKGLNEGTRDLSKQKWSYKIGLKGEALKLHTDAGSSSVEWVEGSQLVKKQPMTWYKTTFDAPGGNEPLGLDMSSMGKGQVWINGQSIGRHWPGYIAHGNCDACDYSGTYSDQKCRTNCGQPSQRWYHVPRSWLKPSGNFLVVFEEWGGDPNGIALAKRTTRSVCADIFEGQPTMKKRGMLIAGRISSPKAHLWCPPGASSLFFRASNLVSSARIRRRIPLLGAFCVLGLGFPSLCSILPSSSYLKTSCPQSPHFVHIERSKFSTQSADKTVQAVKMEGNSNIVPSIVVYVTVPNREAGRKLAGSIVKEKLAACVNIVPGLESVYLWEGKINSDPEEMLIIKTRQSLLEALTEHVKANHEYDVPEVIALPITGGSPQYLEWLKNSTRD